LRDSGCAYADRLRENGVQVHYKEYEDLIHGFQSWAGIIPSAGAAVKDIARAVGELAKTQEALEPAE
jgi:acetyl esterase